MADKMHKAKMPENQLNIKLSGQNVKLMNG
jgi:hypothetical protein